jgi:hypothetical protein
MSEICSCGSGLGNTGVPDCYKSIKVATGIIFVPTYKADGTRVKIAAGTTLDETYFTDAVNEADKQDRWYPMQGITNVTSEQGDPIYDEASNGSKSFVRQGVRPMSFEVRTGGSVLVKQTNAGKCTLTSFFLIDAENKLIGLDLTGTNEFLYPIPVQRESLNAKYIMATDSTVEKVSIAFDWDMAVSDGQLSYMDVEDDVILTDLKGLLDVKATYSGISQTGVTITLEEIYGGVGSKNKVSGLVSGDFVFYNVTDSSAVTASTFTETSDGVYAVTFTSQTVADVIRVTPTKNRYDFSAVVAKTFTIA